MASKHVVIIGGSYGGVGVAHKLLESPNVKVTLINPSETFYFNIAAPRILAKQEIPVEKVLLPIVSAFKYPVAKFEFVLGSVTAIDFQSKYVSIGDGKSIKYDYLLIASGSTTQSSIDSDSIPFKPTNSNNISASIQSARKRIANAKTVIIAGAGPVGVETAGEIAEAYPGTKVTLISSGSRVLDFLKKSASTAAETNLKGLGVNFIYSTKVLSAEKRASGWSVSTSDGKTLQADLYISASGVIPNSSFIDTKYLDVDGWVKVTPSMTVEGISDRSVFAIGDITNHKARFMMKVQEQIPIVAKNIKAVIAGEEGKLTEYTPSTKVMCFVPTGSKTGTGQFGGWVVFSFMVAFVKGKDFFISKAGSFIGLK